MSDNLQESSGLVNPLGLQGESVYNQKGAMGAIPGSAVPPNFGRREQLNLREEDFNLAEPSARNPRESADLTIDMLTGKNNLAARPQFSDEERLQMMNKGLNMPRNLD